MSQEYENYTIPQLVLLQQLAEVKCEKPVIDHSPYWLVYIARKRPVWRPVDLDGNFVNEFIWIPNYAKSAKALVQHGILVEEGTSLYSLTEYGIQLLDRLFPTAGCSHA